MRKSMFGCLLLAAVFMAVAGCAGGGPRSVTLMTWNVHNLFDGKDNGFEYSEFLEAAGWSAEKYRGRVNAVSAAIETVKPLPDVIVFQEIESLKVLEDIALSLPRGYLWKHFANNPGAAVGLGILSRLPLLEARVHSIATGGDAAPRPTLEARIGAGEEAFVVFACHWKSKTGGGAAGENVRRASARVILRRIRELRDSEPELGVIIAGDLNENYDEFYRQNARAICALLPDDVSSARLTGCTGEEGAGPQRDFIVISGNTPPEPVHFPKDAVVLFSPWLGGLENGSYFYRNKWETIDHFLVSRRFFDDALWEYETARVVNDPPFANSTGRPVPYRARTGNGLSDHLPLLLSLRFQQ